MATVPSPSDLAHRAAIVDALHSYCRGIDRLHAPSIEAAYHPGALLDGYGTQKTLTIEEFVPSVLASLRAKYAATQHRLSNITVQLDGDSALVESYILAYHLRVDDGRRLLTFDGRYIDRFECRDGDWRIAHRWLRVDWSDTMDMGEPMSSPFVRSGRDGTDDPFLGGW